MGTPSQERSRRRVDTAETLLIFLTVALIVFGLCVLGGRQAMETCAIQSPHDGQCGLAGFVAYIFGGVAGTVIFATGAIYALIRSYRQPHDD